MGNSTPGSGQLRRTFLSRARCVIVQECKPGVCLLVVAIQVFVFHATPLVNMIYDGWPRGWLVLSVSIFAALLAGVGPGLAGLAAGAGLIWWRGTTFVPMHPGLEVFTAIGLTQILVIHRLQLTRRELQLREEAVVAARDRAGYLHDVAVQANRAKDDFLATLSHELRTPLNVILGYNRMLRGPMATPKFVAAASDIIERNAMAQMRIVEDLLDVQRAITAGVDVQYAPVDFSALAQSVIESFSPAAEAKGLHWAVHLDDVTLECDRARVQQVLWNLLSNAIKFTPEGGCVGVSARRDDRHLVVTVEDSGAGIPAHFLPHVFEPFRQLDMSSTRRHGGLGLGLAIVRTIVESHGGTVAAASEGAGARLTFTLPLTPPVTGTAVPAERPPSLAASR